MIQIPVRLSMGVAQLDAGCSLSTLIRAADAALYRAKHAGRNVVSN
jgi:PleD family two-component response regulator